MGFRDAGNVPCSILGMQLKGALTNHCMSAEWTRLFMSQCSGVIIAVLKRRGEGAFYLSSTGHGQNHSPGSRVQVLYRPFSSALPGARSLSSSCEPTA